MNRCPSRELLANLLEGAIDAADRPRVEEHVGQCPRCRAALQDLTRPGLPSDGVRPEAPDAALTNPIDPQALAGGAPGQETGGPEPHWDPNADTLAPGRVPSEGVWQRGPGGKLPAVPGYEILGVLGRGGMGVVYKARHLALNRPVALKMLAGTGDHEPQYLARFKAEAEAVARFQHPNIVQIYEVGETQERPYLALELVEGGSLADRTGGTPQPPADAARLIETLARAMHAAHECGIVHRDLKPANILLAAGASESRRPSLAEAVPKITDFGVAKRLDVTPAPAAPGSITTIGGIVGTPGYLAPEQIEVEGPRVRAGPTADVYALGAILYDLLTGRPPFTGSTPIEAVLLTLSRDPLPPSRFQPDIPRDLEVICLQCLRKEPARRYASALALADDLARFLGGEPIRARPTPLAERVWKWAKRRPAVASLAALCTVLFLASLALVSWQWARAESRAGAEADAKEEARRAQRTAEKEQRAAEKEQRLARAQKRQAERALARMALDRGRRLCEQGEVGPGLLWMAHALEAAERAEAGAEETSPGTASAIRTNLAAWSPRLVRLRSDRHHGSKVHAVAFHPDGRTLLVGTRGNRDNIKGPGEAFLWNQEAGKRVGPMLLHPDAAVWSAALSPDGKTVLTGTAPQALRLDLSGHQQFTPGKLTAARLWDVSTGKLVGEPLEHPGPVVAVAFSPDGKTFATGCSDGQARLWETATRQPRAQPLPPTELLPTARQGRLHSRFMAVAFSPDGNTLLTGGLANVAMRWDVDSGHAAGPPLRHSAPVSAVAWAPDGQQILTGSADHTAQLWDARTGNRLLPPLPHRAAVLAVGFSPDGRILATSVDDGRDGVFLWDAASGQPLSGPLRHGLPVTAVAFSPDSKRLATACLDGHTRLWDVPESPTRSVVVRHERGEKDLAPAFANDHLQLALSGDGKVLLTQRRYTVRCWDMATARALGTPPTCRPPLLAAALSSDGKLIAAGGNYGRDGKDSFVQLWDATTGTPRGQLATGAPVTRVAFSPDGRLLATASGAARLWVAATGNPLAKGMGADDVLTLAFAADGTLLTSHRDGTVRLWGKDGTAPRQLFHHQARVTTAAFRLDARAVVTGSDDQTAQVWETATGKPLTEPLRHLDTVTAVAYAPDGKTVLTASTDRTARLWDATTGLPLGPPWHHPAVVTSVLYAPGGAEALTGCDDGAVRRCRLPAAVPGTPVRVELWVRALTGQELDEHGAVRALTEKEQQHVRRRLDGMGGPPVP